ncbi:MAG: hypothetical protein KJ985_07965, partial [Proteobacteria bacterium]|nr:hypothetical protein [Pseudomonadota bacterium]
KQTYFFSSLSLFLSRITICTGTLSKPPQFVIMSNSSKGVHFSYQRYLTNRFRDGLGLDKVPVQIVIRDKNRDREEKK